MKAIVRFSLFYVLAAILELCSATLYECGDGVCAEAEEDFCVLDCPATVSPIGATPDDLFSNEQKTIGATTYTGIEAIKRYTLADLNFVSATNRTLPNSVLEIEGSFSVGPFTMGNRSEIPDGDLSVQFTEQVTFSFWMQIPQTVGVIDFAHVTGAFIVNSTFRDTELPGLLFGAKQGWMAITPNDFWSSYGYGSLTDIAFTSRYYAVAYGVEEDDGDYELATMRYDLIYLLTLARMKAATIYELVCNDVLSTSSCLSKGISTSGGSKGGWTSWVHARADDRVYSFQSRGFQVENYLNASITGLYQDSGCNSTYLGLRLRNKDDQVNQLMQIHRWIQYTEAGRGWFEIYSPSEFFQSIPSAVVWSIKSDDGWQITANTRSHDNQFNIGWESTFYYSELESYLSQNNITFRHIRESALDVGGWKDKDKAVSVITLSKHYTLAPNPPPVWTYPKVESISTSRTAHPTLSNKDLFRVETVISDADTTNDVVKLFSALNPNDPGPAERAWNYEVYASDWRNDTMNYDSTADLWYYEQIIPSSFSTYSVLYVRIVHELLSGSGSFVSDASLPIFTNEPAKKTCWFDLDDSGSGAFSSGAGLTGGTSLSGTDLALVISLSVGGLCLCVIGVGLVCFWRHKTKTSFDKDAKRLEADIF